MTSEEADALRRAERALDQEARRARARRIARASLCSDPPRLVGAED